MRALGDKIGSTIIAQSAGVPTISWNGDGLKVRLHEHENDLILYFVAYMRYTHLRTPYDKRM